MIRILFGWFFETPGSKILLGKRSMSSFGIKKIPPFLGDDFGIIPSCNFKNIRKERRRFFSFWVHQSLFGDEVRLVESKAVFHSNPGRKGE